MQLRGHQTPTILLFNDFFVSALISGTRSSFSCQSSSVSQLLLLSLHICALLRNNLFTIINLVALSVNLVLALFQLEFELTNTATRNAVLRFQVRELGLYDT